MKPWTKILLVLWLMLSFSVFQIAGKLEGNFYPVVTGSKINAVETLDDGILVYGTFGKLRNCSFESLKMYLVEGSLASAITVEFRDQDIIRKLGFQKFGPWYLRLNDISDQKIRMISEHRCHPFFNTVTVTEMSDNRKESLETANGTRR